MLLEIKGVDISLVANNQSKLLCQNLNFSLELGETIGILGESGSGKSLTALAITQLLPNNIVVSNGSILFAQQNEQIVDINSISKKNIQKIRGNDIGMIFQEPMSSLNPVFTCGTQLVEAICQHQKISKKNARIRAISLFEKVKLQHPETVFNSFPHQLSGGQKQRVMIAIAISCSPRLLIADEPTTALDVTVQKSILELLKELQIELGMSILFITHDIGVLSKIAHKALVFYKGEIVERGNLSDILHHPKHEYTKHLIRCRNERLISKATTQITENETHPLLIVNNLNVSVKNNKGLFSKKTEKKILHNISFQLYKGETLGLVGESGSGKTTIGRTIMHLIDSQSGTIFFDDKNTSQLSHNELQNLRRSIQIIFQDPFSSLNPKLTVGEMIEEPLFVHKIYNTSILRKARVLELLNLVNLSDEHYNRYPHQFSGGQRQRIGIARALAVEPTLLIFDESVAALDVSIQAQILELLTNLKSKLNLTFIFISHDLEIVRAMSNRMIVIQNGNLIEEGTSNEIFNSPKSDYTKSLIDAIP